MTPLTGKMIPLAEESMVLEAWDAPPVPHAWIALGSKGRWEQTLKRDQDNATVLDWPSRRGEEVQDSFSTWRKGDLRAGAVAISPL